MLLKKHTGCKYKQIGVFLFFFLNCFLVVVPFLHASAKQGLSETWECLTQNQESEDVSSLFISLNEQTVNSFSLQKKQTENRLFKRKEHSFSFIDNEDSSYSFSSLSFPQRPAYYVFLFLYKLF